MKTLKIKLFASLLLVANIVAAQDMWKYFKPEDFAQRRAKLMEKIGDGVAILHGAELPEAYVKFRQDNNFYYLTGVEAPNAVLIINGKTKTSTLLVPDVTSGDIKDEARIKPGPEAAKLYMMTSVISRNSLTNQLNNIGSRDQVVYLVTTPEETTEMSRDRCLQLRTSRMNDAWDGRIPKEINFMNKFKERYPLATIKSLSPILDLMRWVKDAKEIAVLRACGELGARGFDEAMRVTRPGIYEYQVVAACDFIYNNEGAMGHAYFPIAASGEQALSWHYNANNHKIKAGDVMMMDYAPEVGYYVTDITRTWPVEGKFTDTQLQYYNCVKEISEKVIAAMKPGIMIKDLQEIAKSIYAKYGLEKYGVNGIGHFVGMAVHDVGPYDQPLVPGVVFNVEPIIENKEMKLHIRLEDTIVITATGNENLTSKTPTEVEAIYKLMKEKGVGEK